MDDFICEPLKIKNKHKSRLYKHTIFSRNTEKDTVEEIITPTSTIAHYIDKDETLGLDTRSDKKLKSGQYPIDRVIDFHGLTLEEAFDSLLYNIKDAYNLGMKCLLIITGKGKNTREDRDSIKSLFPQWMKHDEIQNRLIKYTDATPRHGGSGAVYVLLKRRK